MELSFFKNLAPGQVNRDKRKKLVICDENVSYSGRRLEDFFLSEMKSVAGE